MSFCDTVFIHYEFFGQFFLYFGIDFGAYVCVAKIIFHIWHTKCIFFIFGCSVEGLRVLMHFVGFTNSFSRLNLRTKSLSRH